MPPSSSPPNRLEPTLAVLLFMATLSSSRVALAQPPIAHNVAFVDAVKLPAKAPLAHERLRATLEEALSASGWSFAQSRPIADCGGSSECLASVSNATGASQVLRMSGEKSGDFGYDVVLELYSPATGKSRNSLVACDICDPARMSELASKSAIILLTSALADETRRKEQPKRSTPPPEPTPSSRPSPPRSIAITAKPAPPPSTNAWVPWTLVGGAALAMGYGAWALYEDGKPTGTPSVTSSHLEQKHYASKTYGLVGLIGGGVAAMVGVIWLITTPSYSAAITASPHHVALQMRF